MTLLFVPGPVNVHPDVRAAQTKEILPHRVSEFEDIFHRAEANARKIFRTETRVFISTSSGTGMQEAAVRNLVNNKMLVCVNGAFSSRWHDVAVTNGKQVTKLEFDWQEPVDPQKVAAACEGQNYEAVLIVHNETSTGLMNPIKEIAAAVRQVCPETLVCVDAVSSISGANLEMDAWGLDLVLSSSQKAIALPPGLSFCAVNDRALEKAKTVENRGWYFDLVRMEKHRKSNSTPATPAISLIYALDLQLSRIMEEGLQNRFDRHSAMASRAQSWALENDLDLFAPEGFRSQTVTTIENKRGLDLKAMSAFLLERDMRVAGGYGQIKERTFRIGHMGELNVDDLNQLLSALDEFLVSN